MGTIPPLRPTGVRTASGLQGGPSWPASPRCTQRPEGADMRETALLDLPKEKLGVGKHAQVLHNLGFPRKNQGVHARIRAFGTYSVWYSLIYPMFWLTCACLPPARKADSGRGVVGDSLHLVRGGGGEFTHPSGCAGPAGPAWCCPSLGDGHRSCASCCTETHLRASSGAACLGPTLSRRQGPGFTRKGGDGQGEAVPFAREQVLHASVPGLPVPHALVLGVICHLSGGRCLPRACGGP